MATRLNVPVVVNSIESAKQQLTRAQLFKHALTSGDTVWLQELLTKDPQLKRATGQMLWHAVLNDQLEVASTLLGAGADPNARQDKPPKEVRSTILHELVKKGDKRYDQLSILAIRWGANVCTRDEYGLTPLDHAIRKKSSIDVVRELVKRGALVSSRKNARLVIEAADHPEAAELVTLLVGEYVDRKTMEQQVVEVLHCCSISIDEDQVLPVVKILLDVKRPLGRRRADKWIVMETIITRKVEMAQLLLEHGFHMDGLIDDRLRDVNGFAQPMTTKNQLIIKYLTLMTFKRKTVNDCDLRIIRGHSEMHAFRKKCFEELEKMKAMKIVNNVSFFAILECAKEMPFLTRNPNVVEKYMEVQRKDEFPIYRNEMDCALQSATIRKRLLREKERVISQSLENTLPFIPLERIIYYFYLNEIK